MAECSNCLSRSLQLKGQWTDAQSVIKAVKMRSSCEATRMVRPSVNMPLYQSITSIASNSTMWIARAKSCSSAPWGSPSLTGCWASKGVSTTNLRSVQAVAQKMPPAVPSAVHLSRYCLNERSPETMPLSQNNRDGEDRPRCGSEIHRFKI